MNSNCPVHQTRQLSLCYLFFTLLASSYFSSSLYANIEQKLVGHWPLDENNGFLVKDISGQAHHGLIRGLSIIRHPQDGRVDGGLYFDGHNGEIDDFVEIPMTGMNPVTGSLLIWAKINENPQSPDSRYVFGHTTLPPYGNRIQLYLDNGDRQLDLGMGDAHARHTNIHTLEIDQWIHIALTWNHGEYHVYVDGKSKANGHYSGLDEFQAIAHLGNNGHNSPTRIFHGTLDELYLYARPLTQKEIQSLILDPLAPSNKPPSVNAGLDHTLRLPDNTLELNGSVSDDDPNQTQQLLHKWTLLKGPAPVSFTPSAEVLDTQIQFPAAGTYILQLQAWDDLGQEDSDTLTVTVLSIGDPDPSTGLVINEFMAGNSYIPYTSPLNIHTQVNGSDVYPDWIEIHNPTDHPIHLAGWFLTDDQGDLTKWPFPKVTLDAGAYLIVFASNKDQVVSPENFSYRDQRGYYHTNFSLSMKGEYLALVTPQGNIAHAYAPYPAQRGQISYGLDLYGNPGFLKQATPSPQGSKSQNWTGGINSEAYIDTVAEVHFSRKRGFYNQPLAVELRCTTANSEIRYTLDGSQPTEAHGLTYNINSPIPITTTTCLRAVALKPNYLASRVSTHTYLFIDHVKNQTRPPDYPREWTHESGFISASGDYAMDPQITEAPAYKDLLSPALLSIPSISIVTDKDHLFNPSAGIYMKPQNHGVQWERPISLEIIDPTGTLDHDQVDCGLRIQGGHTRLPSKNPKHSFRVLFKAGYGTGKMRIPLFGDTVASEFDNIVLRAGGNQSWLHHNTFKRRQPRPCPVLTRSMGQRHTKSHGWHGT